MIIEINGKYELIKKPKTLYGMKCFACKRRMASEEHHLIPSRAYRQKCDDLGLTVGLCHQCHYEAHCQVKTGLYNKLKKVAQRVFEKFIGDRAEWMREFHKNYLWDEGE